MIKDFKKIRGIIFLAEIVAVFFISQMPALIPSLYGIKPNFLLLVAFNIALFETSGRAILLGIVCGLFMDIGYGEYFGFYITLLTVLCFLVSRLKEKFKSINISKAYFLAIFFLFSSLALNFAFIYSINTSNEFSESTIVRYVISFCYTLIFEFVFYYIAKFIFKLTKIKRKQMKYLMARKGVAENQEAYSFLGSD